MVEIRSISGICISASTIVLEGRAKLERALGHNDNIPKKEEATRRRLTNMSEQHTNQA
jgi:hypothetical protein